VKAAGGCAQNVSGNLGRVRRNLIYILTLCYCIVHGQQFGQVKKLLSQGDFVIADKYMSKICKKNDDISYNQRVNRQIVGDYSEILIYFEESFPAKEENVYDVFPYLISVLTHSNKIIYCKVLNNNNSNNIVVEYDYTDTSQVNALKSLYSKMYGLKISIDDFFKSNVVYGSACGYGGQDPDMRVQLNELVHTKDIKGLDKWLSSPITEIQIYAVDGFHQLVTKGYKLSPREQELIQVIKTKKGTVRTCSGCMHMTENISQLTEDFRFQGSH